VSSALLTLLAKHFGARPSAEDVFAYLAAVAAHSGYTTTFAADLADNPGLRIPITIDAALFAEAAALGRRVIWLHTYGQRFADPVGDRPRRAPRIDPNPPRVSAEHPIPTAPGAMPDALSHDESTNQLRVGDGVIDNVTPAMWTYEISGVHILTKWFSYRRRTRERPTMGRRVSPLLGTQPKAWLPEYTRDLIDLLNVLGLLAELEPHQAELLDRILSGHLLPATEKTPVTRKSSRSQTDQEPSLFDVT
jgi:hypothetical protein